MRQLLTTFAELLGAISLAIAGFLIAPWAGFAALGVLLIAGSVFLA